MNIEKMVACGDKSSVSCNYNERTSSGEVFTDTDDGFDENSTTAPKFVTELSESLRVIEGDSARFEAIIDCDPTPQVVWLKDGEIINSSGRISLSSNGRKHSLTIRDVRESDDAEYECHATNDYGESSSFGELYVLCDK